MNVPPALRDLIVEPGQGVNEALRDFGPRHERALALDPLNDTLVLQLRERLPHNGAGDSVLLAQAMLSRQRVSRIQRTFLDDVVDQPAQLVVHRDGRVSIDAVGG